MRLGRLAANQVGWPGLRSPVAASMCLPGGRAEPPQGCSLCFEPSTPPIADQSAPMPSISQQDGRDCQPRRLWIPMHYRERICCAKHQLYQASECRIASPMRSMKEVDAFNQIISFHSQSGSILDMAKALHGLKWRKRRGKAAYRVQLQGPW